MKALKKLIALGTGVAMLTASAAFAEEACDDSVTYYDSYGTTNLAPSIALGVVAVAAVAAVLINNSNEGSNHSHVHCD